MAGAARPAPAGGTAHREERILGIIETARGKRAKFRDERITMAHGAGGKATQSMIEGLFVPAFGSERARGDGRRGRGGGRRRRAGDDHRLASWSSRSASPAARSATWRSTGRSTTSRCPGARPLALTLSLILEEGLPADELRAEVEAMRRGREAAGVQIVAGDTKVVERGAADKMYVCTTGVGLRDPRARMAPDALRPGDRILLSGHDRRARHRDHARARRVRARRRDRVGHALAVAGGRRAAGGGRPVAALHARRHPRRRGVGAERAGPRVAGGDARARGGGADRPGGGRRVRDLGDRPDVRGQRGQARRLRGARGRGRGAWPRCARCRAASARRRSARCGPSRRAWCWWRRALAASG